MQHQRRATLKEVAKASGLSPATVSFVLNSTPGQTIPEPTRERVRAAAEELGYTPHGLARALREGSSRVVVLNVGDLRGGSSLEGFVRGMRDELGAHGYTLVVHAGDDVSSADLFAELRPHRVVDLAELYAADAAREDDGGWADGLAAHTMAQFAHLADRGHRRIAFAVPAGTRTERIVSVRRRDASEACRRLGLAPPPPLAIANSPTTARTALARHRHRHPETTAIATFDDETALRVLAAMGDLGLTAPSDLAVIGFDDSRLGALWRPALTTVRIDADSFGRRLARHAIDLPHTAWTTAPSVVVQRDTT